MIDKRATTSIGIAIIGAAGIVAAAVVGYQSGTNTVNKDYVQIAMTNLRDEKASPELRRWSSQILNELSPVPMGTVLEEQLAEPAYITPKIPVPEFASEKCPDLIRDGANKAFENTGEAQKTFERFVREYEACRTRYDSLVSYLNDISRSSGLSEPVVRSTR